MADDIKANERQRRQARADIKYWYLSLRDGLVTEKEFLHEMYTLRATLQGYLQRKKRIDEGDDPAIAH